MWYCGVDVAYLRLSDWTRLTTQRRREGAKGGGRPGQHFAWAAFEGTTFVIFHTCIIYLVLFSFVFNLFRRRTSVDAVNMLFSCLLTWQAFVEPCAA